MTSAIAASQVFASIRVIGGLLPADMLARIADGKDISGSRPADYHVVGTRSVQDDAERHWDYLKGAWRTLRAALGDNGHDPAGLATENWLLPLFEEHGFGRLQRLPAGIRASDQAGAFPVSHRWEHVPIHLAAWGADLDRRPAGGGLPPQSMLQECLNRSPEHLWGILGNGRHLRILRDSTSLVGSSYIDIDLEAMFDGELFAEFVVLYRLLHVSRYEIPDGAAPSACRMEHWRTEAIEAGTRALDQLRDGVQDAIAHLGTGFLRHPANTRLRDDLDTDLFKRALLRLIYRLLFWFVAEDRDILFAPGTDENTRNRYEKYFSSKRLRDIAPRRAGTTHGDLWEAIQIVLNGLADENGLPELGLPGLGGIYDDIGTDQILRGLALSNEHLLASIRSLARIHDASTKRFRPVDYRNLGAEELGSIYESLLELVPKWSKEERRFLLDVMPGNERKSTGSYYTPTSLIDCLLDTTLNPVLDDTQKRAEAKASANGEDAAAAIGNALLSITVCDPACGSGHFLVAAARRIAKRLAAVRERIPEPTPDALRVALRDVVTHCIYGVDLNPMAVELAKVSLWLEALEPGRPLGFLDARIKRGNALIGATPSLMAEGIPDDAFKPIEGDDKKWAAYLRKANTKEREGQEGLFAPDDYTSWQSNEMLAAQLSGITNTPGGSLREVHRQAAAYQDWQQSAEYQHARQVADAWCASFLWCKIRNAPPAVTQAVFRVLRAPETGVAGTRTEIARLRSEFGFFHWHLEFPEIFHVSEVADQTVDPATGWSGGFTCLLGNPPWENIEFKESEFFGSRDEEIALAIGSKRKKLIAALRNSHPSLYEEYKTALRNVKAVAHYVSDSAAYPLYSRGMREVRGANRYKTDALFLERSRRLIARRGRLGMVLPTGVATYAVTQFLFQDLTHQNSIVSLYDFENQRKRFFKDVHASYKFCLLTLSGDSSREGHADFSFFLHAVAELDSRDKSFQLTSEELLLLNPNTGTCPVFRSRRDAEITLDIYRRVPVLYKEGDPGGNPWNIRFSQSRFNSTDDSELFFGRADLEITGWHLDGSVFHRGVDQMLPLYEGKMLNLYDNRWATFEWDGSIQQVPVVQKQDPDAVNLPRYWVKEAEVRAQASGRQRGSWLLGLRDIARSTDDRTVIVFAFPGGAVGDSVSVIDPEADVLVKSAFLACLSSYVFDYVGRQKIDGANVGLFMLQQLPALPPNVLSEFAEFISTRVLELVYTNYEVAQFARDLGDKERPFRWDDERRFFIRAELDALFFKLYGISREDVAFIMDTFSGIKDDEISKFHTFRTKETILNFYDSMTAADAAGTSYETTIKPVPGSGPRHSVGYSR